MITLKEAIKGTTAKFVYACSGVLYYTIEANEETYMFPVDMNDKGDVGSAYFNAEEKGIFFMRYIRKSMEKETFIKIK